MKLRKVRWSDVGDGDAPSLPADLPPNIPVSSVFYDRARAPLKDIGNLRAGCNIGGAVISRFEHLLQPSASSLSSTSSSSSSSSSALSPATTQEPPSSRRSYARASATLSRVIFLPLPLHLPTYLAQASVLTRLCSHIPG